MLNIDLVETSPQPQDLARLDVVGALAAVRLLDNHRDQRVHIRFHGVGHLALLNCGPTRARRLPKSITPMRTRGFLPPRLPLRSSIPAGSPCAPPASQAPG